MAKTKEATTKKETTKLEIVKEPVQEPVVIYVDFKNKKVLKKE